MAHLILRCTQTNRMILTGIEIDQATFDKMHKRRTISCKLCGQDHTWELADQIPEYVALMSLKAEDFLGKAVESEEYAAKATLPNTRRLFEHIATQWYELAIDCEAKGTAQH